MRPLVCVLVVLAVTVVGVVGLVSHVNQDNDVLVVDVLTIEADLEKFRGAVVKVGNEIADVFSGLHVADGCECSGSTCGCCSHLEEATIHLNATACVNVTYLSQEYGISVTATLNKYTIYNETVSARNPPPICVGAPYVGNLADLCIKLHDINATRHTLSACAAAEAHLKHVRIAHYELGCFAIGKPTRGLKAPRGATPKL